MVKRTGYCVRCKLKREIAKVREAMSKHRRRMAKGVCSKCGTKMSTFIPNKVAGGVR